MRLMMLVPVVAFCASQWSCTLPLYFGCADGLWPIDGSTHVPLDVIPVVRTRDWRLPTYPPLAPGIQLHDLTDDRPVPVSIQIRDQLAIDVIPDEPLKPDHDYELVGIDREAMDWSNHGELRQEHGNRHYLSVVRFSTGGQPQVLGSGFNGTTLFIRFSEPIENFAAVDAVRLWDQDGYPLDVQSAQTSADGLELSVVPSDARALAAFSVESVQTLSGATLIPAPSTPTGTPAPRDMWKGLPCSDF